MVTLTLYACDSAGAGTGAHPADSSDLGLIQDAMKQVEREGGVCVASPRQTALGSRDRVVRG